MKYYIMHNPDKNLLIKLGFHWSRLFSDEDQNAYVFVFPVYRHNLYNILECRLIVYLESGDIRIDVRDVDTKGLYAPFYSEPPSHKYILGSIRRKINQVLKKIGVQRRGKGDLKGED